MKKFSQIAYLGKLDQYSKMELINALQNFQVKTIKVTEQTEQVIFEGEQVRIDILYDLEGNYKQIIREEWFDLKQHFNYPRI